MQALPPPHCAPWSSHLYPGDSVERRGYDVADWLLRLEADKIGDTCMFDFACPLLPTLILSLLMKQNVEAIPPRK